MPDTKWIYFAICNAYDAAVRRGDTKAAAAAEAASNVLWSLIPAWQ